MRPLLILLLTAPLAAQQFLYAGLRWRNIGPYRGARTVAAGIPSEPNIFCIGASNGGVWKSTEAVRTAISIPHVF
jgi:hypothetical protein